MATLVPETSRTFSEYLLLPNLTRRDCIPANVDLRAPLPATGHPRRRTCTIGWLASRASTSHAHERSWTITERQSGAARRWNRR